MPTYDEYKNYLTNLYNDEKWRDYIVNYLIFTYNVRNGDLYLKITDNKQDLKNKDVNYLYLTYDNIGYYVKEITLNKIGEGNIMKLILKYYDNNSNYNKIKQISKNRGTDIETLLTDYNLNTKN